MSPERANLFKVAANVAGLVTMLVAGSLTATQAGAVEANLPTPWNGVYERIAVGGDLLWMTVLAVALLGAPRQPPDDEAIPPLAARATPGR